MEVCKCYEIKPLRNNWKSLFHFENAFIISILVGNNIVFNISISMNLQEWNNLQRK